MDFIHFWDVYYYYKNEVEENSNAFDSSDFGIIFKHVKNLLKHIKYQKEVIVT
jgi:hypothetical protein